jgi:hypothetical protein
VGFRSRHVELRNPVAGFRSRCASRRAKLTKDATQSGRRLPRRAVQQSAQLFHYDSGLA